MVIDQVNEGASITVNDEAQFFSVDQFFSIGKPTSGVFTVQRLSATPPTGFINYIRATCTTADASIGAADRYIIANSIEGYNIIDFLFGSASAKTVTLSFWVRSSLTGTYSGSIQNYANNRGYGFEYAINSANTWEQKTVTLTGDTTGTWPTDSSGAMEINFALAVGSNFQGTVNTWVASNVEGTSGGVNWMSSNSSRTFDLTGVQFEIGSQATSFEFVPFSIALARCQRYYAKTFEPGTAPASSAGTTGAVEYRAMVAGTAGANGAYWTFPVPMRAAPAMTYFNPSASGTTWRNQTDNGNSGASGSQGSGSKGQFITNAQVSTDGVGERLDIHAVANSRL